MILDLTHNINSVIVQYRIAGAILNDIYFFLFRPRFPIAIRVPVLTDIIPDLLLTIYVAHPVVADSTGEGLARSLLETLKKVVPPETMAASIIGGVFDGAMLNVNVSYYC